MNALSAVCMAAAVGFVAAAARRLPASRAAAAGGAGAFALAFEPWRAAAGAEVFALHALFVAALAWLALRWPTTGRPPYLEALVLGLGCAHHQTTFLLAAAFGYWVWAHRDRLGSNPGGTVLGCVAVFAAAALLPYGLLLWFGRRDAALVWGNVTALFDQSEPVFDPTVPPGPDGSRTPIAGLQEGLWHHVKRGAYGAKLGSAEGGGLQLPYLQGLRLGAGWLWIWLASGCGGKPRRCSDRMSFISKS